MEGPKTATEYYYYLGKREEDMPKKLFEKYADERGMTKEKKRRFLNNMTRFVKQQINEAEYRPLEYEEVLKKNEEKYKQWLKGIDWKYIEDSNPDRMHFGKRKGETNKQVADRLKEEREKQIKKYRQEEENKDE